MDLTSAHISLKPVSELSLSPDKYLVCFLFFVVSVAFSTSTHRPRPQASTPGIILLSPCRTGVDAWTGIPKPRAPAHPKMMELGPAPRCLPLTGVVSTAPRAFSDTCTPIHAIVNTQTHDASTFSAMGAYAFHISDLCDEKEKTGAEVKGGSAYLLHHHGLVGGGHLGGGGHPVREPGTKMHNLSIYKDKRCGNGGKGSPYLVVPVLTVSKVSGLARARALVTQAAGQSAPLTMASLSEGEKTKPGTMGTPCSIDTCTRGGASGGDRRGREAVVGGDVTRCVLVY